MSFEPDSTDNIANEITELDLLMQILIELRKLSIMVSEMSEVYIEEEDL